MVLSTHIALHSLAMFGSLGVDVLSSFVASDKGNSLDIRMFANLSSSVETSLDDVEDTFR